MKVKEKCEKVDLKLNIRKTKIMASGPITSWQIDGETMDTVTDFAFLGSKITVDGDCSHEIKRYLLLGRKAMINLDSILKSRAITLTRWTSVGKEMSLIFDILSRLIIAFLPRSKGLLISSPHYLASIITNSWGLSCGPVVESALQMHRSRIQSLVWELRSHMLWSN